MIIVTTEIVVNKVRPSQIFDWIMNLTPEKYRQWDPKAHVGKIKRPALLKEGDKFWFEEMIDEYKVSFKWKIIKIDKPNLFLMKAIVPFPIYLQLSFLPFNEDTKVIHELRIGFNFFGLEEIVDYFINFFIMPEKKITAIKKHATEEFQNLEKIL
ncbi:MAG: hypothetical protein C0403_16155 [Desulfobacterium sp.]|nr:hypothetical protein [Desulfobacterium sp.]